MCESTAGSAANSSAEVGVPPPPQRRPRVREVSSRFMSPSIQSNATPIPTPSENPRSKSVHRRQSSRDENQVPETSGNLDTPLVPPHTVAQYRSSVTNSVATVQKKQQQQQQRLNLRQMKENDEQNQQQQQASNVRVSSRPDTPIGDRIIPSRYRQTPQSINRGNQMNSSSNCKSSPVTAAHRLLQEMTSGNNNYRDNVERKLSRTSSHRYDESDSSSSASIERSSSCPNSPLFLQTTKARNLPETRSSVPDVDKWFADRSYNNGGKVTSDCARSLNFSSTMKMGGNRCLPPHPSSCVRQGVDAKKGKSVSNHQDDVHSLKMLYNHYLQWRFANAKAEASFSVQKREAEIQLYSLARKLSDFHEEVKKNRCEYSMLQAIKNLSIIVEAQMPYLEAWSALEEKHSTTLSGISNALLNSSLRVPIGGDVHIEVKDLQDALNSAVKVMELIGIDVQRFMTKVEEVDSSISKLARVVSGERALIEECGDLLSKEYTAQVIEWSLRSSVIQWNHRKIKE